MGRAGGRYAGLENCPEEWRTRKTVHVHFPIAWEAFGQPFDLGGAYARDAYPGKVTLAVAWRHEMQQLLDQGLIRSHPVQEVAGGWDGILAGLNKLKSGDVHAQKLVVRLGEVHTARIMNDEQCTTSGKR